MKAGRAARRSLQARLALAYAAGIYAAGCFVIVLVDVPLASVQATAPEGRPVAGVITAGGPGIGLPQLLLGSAVALVVLIPVALALGWYVAGRFLHPLRAITATAQVISAGNLERRLALGEPADELTELGHTLDDLFARLQASFDAQRHFVANASHELRTPVAGLRTLLEVTLADPDADAATLRTACQEALELGSHQERLIAALLTLATGERGLTRREPVDLADVVAAALATRRDQAAVRNLAVSERLAPAAISGDAHLLESLVANLLDNAIRYNHPGGHVSITTGVTDGRTADGMTSGVTGGHAVLTVANSGPVIPADQVQRLFHPFQRLAPERGGHRDGHGLGLAIVNAVTQAHHATLTTTARPEGGLSITVRFPH